MCTDPPENDRIPFKMEGESVFHGDRIGAQAMGLEVTQAIETVCSMRRSDFYKSMTTHAASQVWQDVYCPETPAGIAHVKVALRKQFDIFALEIFR